MCLWTDAMLIAISPEPIGLGIKKETKLEKVSIGHRCPRQNAIQKKFTYVTVTGTA